MASTGSMTASVWLAPMIPKLPLPLATRVHRLLGAKPGAATQDHALRLCEGIVAYAACVRVSLAAALVPAGHRAALGTAVAEFRRVVQHGDASSRNYRDLLRAAAEVIDEVEPGHPLGLAELTRPRTSWVARMQLVEALDPSVVSEASRSRAIDGGIAGIFDLWVELIEQVESGPAANSESDAYPWLPALGDLIVDLLSSSVFGGASLVYPEQAVDGGLGDLRRLHGLESEIEPADTDAAALARELGVVCWRLDDRVVSSCGLLSYWVDEHEFEHIGVIAKQLTVAEYFDFGAGKRSPAKQASGRVEWGRLHANEATAAVVVGDGRSRAPLIAIAIVAGLLLAVGLTWTLLRDPDQTQARRPTSGEPRTNEDRPESEPLAPELDDEIVIEAQDQTGTGGTARRSGTASETGETGETGAEAEAPTVPVWFESERNLGICRVSYAGRTQTANLHLKTRQPEGKLEFSYRCGEYRGRGSIDVKPRRVNGVLFCKKAGAVKVKTVRSNEGRCDR